MCLINYVKRVDQQMKCSYIYLNINVYRFLFTKVDGLINVVEGYFLTKSSSKIFKIKYCIKYYIKLDSISVFVYCLNV